MKFKITNNRLGGGIFGIDIVKSFAIFSVIAGHFFMCNSPFNKTIYDGSFSMFIQGMLFFFFQIGVPLFMITTGFLNFKKKTLDWQYSKRCFKVISAYLFFSLITWAFKIFYKGEYIDFVTGIKGILDFHGIILYGWYIEMWIGLYFVTPFLNILYDSIETPRQKRLLIMVLFMLTALPDFFNRYNFHLFPGYWVSIYPVMFFMIGRFIRDFNPVFPVWKLLPFIILPCMINPSIGLVHMTGKVLNQFAGSCYGIFGTIVAVAVFLLFYRIDIRTNFTRMLISRISQLSLDIYLCCYMVDQFVYPLILDRFFVTQQQFGLLWWLPTSLIVLSLCGIVSELKELLFKLKFSFN